MTAAPLPQPQFPSGLPTADDTSREHSKRVEQHLLDCIAATPDGFLSFEGWMAEALPGRSRVEQHAAYIAFRWSCN